MDWLRWFSVCVAGLTVVVTETTGDEDDGDDAEEDSEKELLGVASFAKFKFSFQPSILQILLILSLISLLLCPRSFFLLLFVELVLAALSKTSKTRRREPASLRGEAYVAMLPLLLSLGWLPPRACL